MGAGISSSPGVPSSYPALEGPVRASHLGSLPPKVLGQLLSGSSRRLVPAGSILHREGDEQPHVEIVLSGLVRAFVTAPDGRTMTVRYVRPGGLFGVVSLFASPFSMPATVQAVTETELLALQSGLVQRMTEQDVRVARVLIDELSERVLAFISEIPGSAFATVRQRVARHLLDLASEHQQDSDLVAAIGQQDLADAVGTVREVVVRALRDFRQQGLIRTERRGVVLLDPERLAAEFYQSPTRVVSPKWNLSR